MTNVKIQMTKSFLITSLSLSFLRLACHSCIGRNPDSNLRLYIILGTTEFLITVSYLANKQLSKLYQLDLHFIT